MSVKLGPCDKCGEVSCRWRGGTWKADWMLHDPGAYFEWARWKIRTEAQGA